MRILIVRSIYITVHNAAQPDYAFNIMNGAQNEIRFMCVMYVLFGQRNLNAYFAFFGISFYFFWFIPKQNKNCKPNLVEKEKCKRTVWITTAEICMKAVWKRLKLHVINKRKKWQAHHCCYYLIKNASSPFDWNHRNYHFQWLGRIAFTVSNSIWVSVNRFGLPHATQNLPKLIPLHCKSPRIRNSPFFSAFFVSLLLHKHTLKLYNINFGYIAIVRYSAVVNDIERRSKVLSKYNNNNTGILVFCECKYLQP